MISAVVLAAGLSTRMGFCKQLALIKGKTMIEHVVDTALNSRVNEVILVLGFMTEKIVEKFQGKPRVKIVFNRNYLTGLSSSVKAGIKAVSKDSEAAIFMLGDQPLVKPLTINKLIEAYRKTRNLLVVPSYRGVRGNPILISRKLFKELKGISGDTGGRVLLAKFKNDVLEVEVEDPGILFDVDDFEALRKARESL